LTVSLTVWQQYTLCYVCL